MKTHSSSQHGQAALITVLFFVFISTTLVGGFSGLAASELKAARALERSKQSFAFAEGGAEDALYRIRAGKNMPSEVIYTDGSLQAKTTVSQTTDTRQIRTEGLQSDAGRNVEVSVVSWIGASFSYGAETGAGGIDMENTSRINGAGGAGGSVFSNGPIRGESGAIITGDVFVATEIEEDTSARAVGCAVDQIAGQADPYIDFAQSFKPSQTKSLAKVSLYIKKVNNPSNTQLRIAANNGDLPDDESLASAAFSSASVGSNYAWIDVIFPDPVVVNAGQTYWIILDAGKNANNYWVWCKETGAGYADGVAKSSKNWTQGAWAPVSGDMNFKIFLGTGASVIDNVTIYGDAHASAITASKICGNAYYQTIDSSSLTFLNSPSSPSCPAPLTPGTAFPAAPVPAVQPMPISDGNIQDWKTAAAQGNVINGNCGDSGDAACRINNNGTLSLGPKKINGNLVLTKKQTLIVTGVLYFTGSINIDSSSGATIKCDPSFGSKGCVIVTDSWIHVKNSAIFQGSGSAGSYILILSTLGTCQGQEGDQRPECTHHNAAMDLHNNATGAIFYAGDSMINLHNGVGVTEITAWSLRLDSGATITYEEGLISALFSSGPTGGWNIQQWQEAE